MAHGLPDYYRGVDIAYQALAQLMVRPTYGAARTAYGSKVVTASAETELCSVIGAGLIYGGVIYLDHTASQRQAKPWLYIDGQNLGQLSLQWLYKWNVLHPTSLPFYLLAYDDAEYKYAVGLSPGFTFESSFKLAYEEFDGATPTVYYSIQYALIT